MAMAIHCMGELNNSCNSKCFWGINSGCNIYVIMEETEFNQHLFAHICMVLCACVCTYQYECASIVQTSATIRHKVISLIKASCRIPH